MSIQIKFDPETVLWRVYINGVYSMYTNNPDDALTLQVSKSKIECMRQFPPMNGAERRRANRRAERIGLALAMAGVFVLLGLIADFIGG